MTSFWEILSECRSFKSPRRLPRFSTAFYTDLELDELQGLSKGRGAAYRRYLGNVQADLRDFLNAATSADQGGDPYIEGMNLILASWQGDTWNLAYFTMSPRSRSGKFDVKAWGRAAKANLMLLLNGLPRNSIRSCKECGKYFVHLSKKPKYYCAPRCTSKAHARARAQDPKYKEKQAKIMREQHRKKQAEKRGVPPDKVLILERKRKY